MHVYAPRLSVVMRKVFSIITCIIFLATSLISPAQAQNVFNLPTPGQMVGLSDAFAPVVLKGVSIHPEDPLLFDFMVDNGHTGLTGQALTDETTKLVKYFLAGLTVPQKDLWVNLSPVEQDRIMADDLSHTDVGRDMLAQDYILKQVTASLMYPEKDLGRQFWAQVYQRAQEQTGSTDIPLDSFNKVWITPADATVYQNGNHALVADARLKVMLESDFIAMENMGTGAASGRPLLDHDEAMESAKLVMREVIIPVLEKEVNEGRNFAPLRQIFRSMILAGWYKNALKDSLLNQVYANTNKVEGIEIPQKDAREQVYAQYMQAFEKGVYNYVKEEFDQNTGETLPRKYFSGGLVVTIPKTVDRNIANDAQINNAQMITGELSQRSYKMETSTDDAKRPEQGNVNNAQITGEDIQSIRAALKVVKVQGRTINIAFTGDKGTVKDEKNNERWLFLGEPSRITLEEILELLVAKKVGIPPQSVVNLLSTNQIRKIDLNKLNNSMLKSAIELKKKYKVSLREELLNRDRLENTGLTEWLQKDKILFLKTMAGSLQIKNKADILSITSEKSVTGVWNCFLSIDPSYFRTKQELIDLVKEHMDGQVLPFEDSFRGEQILDYLKKEVPDFAAKTEEVVDAPVVASDVDKAGITDEDIKSIRAALNKANITVNGKKLQITFTGEPGTVQAEKDVLWLKLGPQKKLDLLKTLKMFIGFKFEDKNVLSQDQAVNLFNTVQCKSMLLLTSDKTLQSLIQKRIAVTTLEDRKEKTAKRRERELLSTKRLVRVLMRQFDFQKNRYSRYLNEDELSEITKEMKKKERSVFSYAAFLDQYAAAVPSSKGEVEEIKKKYSNFLSYQDRAYKHNDNLSLREFLKLGRDARIQMVFDPGTQQESDEEFEFQIVDYTSIRPDEREEFNMPKDVQWFFFEWAGNWETNGYTLMINSDQIYDREELRNVVKEFLQYFNFREYRDQNMGKIEEYLDGFPDFAAATEEVTDGSAVAPDANNAQIAQNDIKNFNEQIAKLNKQRMIVLVQLEDRVGSVEREGNNIFLNVGSVGTLSLMDLLKLLTNPDGLKEDVLSYADAVSILNLSQCKTLLNSVTDEEWKSVIENQQADLLALESAADENEKRDRQYKEKFVQMTPILQLLYAGLQPGQSLNDLFQPLKDLDLNSFAAIAEKVLEHNVWQDEKTGVGLVRDLIKISKRNKKNNFALNDFLNKTSVLSFSYRDAWGKDQKTHVYLKLADQFGIESDSREVIFQPFTTSHEDERVTIFITSQVRTAADLETVLKVVFKDKIREGAFKERLSDFAAKTEEASLSNAADTLATAAEIREFLRVSPGTAFSVKKKSPMFKNDVGTVWTWQLQDEGGKAWSFTEVVRKKAARGQRVEYNLTRTDDEKIFMKQSYNEKIQFADKTISALVIALMNKQVSMLEDEGVKDDRAQRFVSAVDPGLKGGIDLGHGDYLKVISTDAAGMPQFDPAELLKLQKDLRGIIPVPVGVPQPLNVRPLLGLDPRQDVDADLQLSQMGPVENRMRFGSS